jgi:hypothetical protein
MSGRVYAQHHAIAHHLMHRQYGQRRQHPAMTAYTRVEAIYRTHSRKVVLILQHDMNQSMEPARNNQSLHDIGSMKAAAAAA